jgi:hypothetical protein
MDPGVRRDDIEYGANDYVTNRRLRRPEITPSYLLFSARLNRNTPCSPNMFQNHQGMLTRSGRP